MNIEACRACDGSGLSVSLNKDNVLAACMVRKCSKCGGTGRKQVSKPDGKRRSYRKLRQELDEDEERLERAADAFLRRAR